MIDVGRKIGVVAAVLFLFAPLVYGQGLPATQVIDQFRGLNTTIRADKLGLSIARECTDFYLDAGNLVKRGGLDDCNTDVTAASPVRLMAYYEPLDRILFYSNDLYGYNIPSDVTQSLMGGDLDSCSTIQGDSTVIGGWAGPAGPTLWLKWVLADVPSVVINETSYNIVSFYSDSILILSDTAIATEETTIDISGGIAGDDPLDYYIFNDTVAVLDGVNLTLYAGDALDSVTPPTYWAEGDADSVIKHGDTLFVVDEFDSIAVGKEILLNASDAAFRGQPYTILRVDSTGSDWHNQVGTGAAMKRVLLAADSSTYANNLAFPPLQCHYVVWDYTGRTYQNWYPTASSWTDVGTFGPLHYWKGRLSPDPGLAQRAWDCKYVTVRDKPASNTYSQAKLLKEGASMYVVLWDTNSTMNYQGKTQIAVYNSTPAVTYSSTDQTSNGYKYGCVGRDRVWYGGKTDSLYWIAWSALDNFDSIVGDAPLPGNVAVTAMWERDQAIMIGTTDRIYRATGYAEAEFQRVPTSSGVGVVSNATVVRNPDDNLDYFMAKSGLYKTDGMGATAVGATIPSFWTDSVNWTYGSGMAGAIWRGHYLLSYPGPSSTKNNRVLDCNLVTEDWTQWGGVHAGCFLVVKDPYGDDALYIGSADSGAVFKYDAAANTDTADYFSGWYDFGDRSLRKGISSYALTTYSDLGNVIVNFYTDLSETVKWADTLVLSAGFENNYRSVSPLVVGQYLSWGIRGISDTVEVSSLWLNLMDRGRAWKSQ